MYRSDKRLLLTEDGQIVGPNDPRGKTLLVAEGGELPYQEAIRYGLVPDRYAPEADKKSEALPLPTSAETAEKAKDVLPKSLGTDAKTAKPEVKTEKK